MRLSILFCLFLVGQTGLLFMGLSSWPETAFAYNDQHGDQPWPKQAIKIQWAYAYNIFQSFWDAPFPAQGKTFAGPEFKNTLTPQDIRLLGDYLTKSLLQYLQQDPILAQEINPQLVQSPRKIKAYHPFESPALMLSEDEQKSLPPRSLVVLGLKHNPNKKPPQSPLGQYLAMLQEESAAERATLIFDGEVEFKHYTGYFAPQSRSVFVAAQILAEMLTATSLEEVLQNSTLAHEEFHRRQFLLIRENTATLTTGIVGALEDQKIAALTHLAHTRHQEAFYLEEAYAHALSLRLLLKQLKTAVATITAGQNAWPLEVFTLRGQVNRRFQRCFDYITAAWRLNTYIYHAFGQYRDGLAAINWANDSDQNLPFISEENLFYFPVTHTFKWTINEQGQIDRAYPATFTYYYALPAAVLADAQVRPDQRLDHLLVLNAKNLAKIQDFIHQQNAYLQELATRVRYLWQYWLAIYYFSPHAFAVAMPKLTATAQELPWPRPWPPGRKAYQEHEVISLARIDNFTADFFRKAPPLGPELAD